MPLPERRFDVLLNQEKTGTLHVRGDDTWFVLDPDYVANPKRAVLGLRFEEDLDARHPAHLRLPPWFSNLLPEGTLRRWIADERGVSADREMELLAKVADRGSHALPQAEGGPPPDAFRPLSRGLALFPRRSRHEVLARKPR